MLPLRDPEPMPSAPGVVPNAPIAEPIDAPSTDHSQGSSFFSDHAGAAHGGTCNDCDAGKYELWGDYLLMYAHRDALDYAVNSPNLVQSPGGTIQSLDWQTQSGFRVGGGYQVPGTGWLFGATFTYFHTKDDQFITAANGGTLYTTLTRGGSYDDVTSAAGMTNLDYNVLDVELSKRFCPTSGLDLTLFGGGRFALINQELTAIYNGGSMNAQNAQVMSPVYFYGGGLTAGFESMVELAKGSEGQLGLYARARGSLVSGEVRNLLNETAANGTVSVVDVSDKYHTIIPVADIGLGVAMEWKNCYLRVGYEMTNWFGLIRSPDFPDAANTGTVGRRTSDLSLEGLAVRLGVDF